MKVKAFIVASSWKVAEKFILSPALSDGMIPVSVSTLETEEFLYFTAHNAYYDRHSCLTKGCILEHRVFYGKMIMRK